MAAATASEFISFSEEGEGGVRAACGGDWVVAQSQAIDRALTAAAPVSGQRLQIDLSGVARFDTVGAWLVHRLGLTWRRAGGSADIVNASENQQVLLAQIDRAGLDDGRPVPAGAPWWRRRLVALGQKVVEMLAEMVALVAFVGQVVVACLRILVSPRRLRLTATVAQMSAVGLTAMPIVGLISFLIGLVIAFQGVDLLRLFGAEIYVVNLVGIGVLRELGILLTSIVVAGRSGSAFTAQIGSMKLREEIDAMRTLGLDPTDVLVVPRVLALMIMLPGLTFFSDMMGVLGGMSMSWVSLGISPDLFLDHLLGAVTWKTFAVGLIKAPFFAAVISVVGCKEGFLVAGSADSVGSHTTQSVVKSIFLVIVLDAAFSIFFSVIHF